MTFDGHLAPVRGLPDVGLHRNNLLSRLSLGHRTHLLFALVASAFTATEQKLGRPGPLRTAIPFVCLLLPHVRPRPDDAAHHRLTDLPIVIFAQFVGEGRILGGVIAVKLNKPV